MSTKELQSKIQATKSFLQREIVRNRIQSDPNALTFREIGLRMDLIHEVERVGLRNLGERENRKLVKMISELEENRRVSLN
jgi:hypothetical protein